MANGNGHSESSKLNPETDTLLEAFSLIPSNSSPLLQEWIEASGQLTPLQSSILDDIYEKSIKKIRGWNEEELKMKFISHLFYIADVEIEGKISTFFERSLSGTIGKYKLSVKCDCLLATPRGLNTPKEPYFFLQEFKKQKGDNADPEGQILAAMLLAQDKNNDQKPIYGAWLNGPVWYFSLLDGKNYFTSRSFDAADKTDLLQIVFILRKLQDLITQP